MNKIRVYDNFISSEGLIVINKIIEKEGYTFGWKSDKTKEYRHWNLSFFGGGDESVANIGAKKEDLRYPILWNIWEKINKDNNRKLVRLYSNAYTYGTEGTVHCDSKKESSYTHLIYLNEKWQMDWAGETVFLNEKKDEILLSVIPKAGRMVEFSGTIHHAARSVTKFCTTTRRVLVFKSLIIGDDDASK